MEGSRILRHRHTQMRGALLVKGLHLPWLRILLVSSLLVGLRKPLLQDLRHGCLRHMARYRAGVRGCKRADATTREYEGGCYCKRARKCQWVRKKVTGWGAPMSLGWQRERHIRIWKEWDWMRGTHPLETADRGACQAIEGERWGEEHSPSALSIWLLMTMMLSWTSRA
jgi:hypothetical protein